VFPKVKDYHKKGHPMIPNGLGVVYVLVSTAFLLLLDWIKPEGIENANAAPLALTLAICILFGGFMGLLDDWMDLKWRYKAFFPLVAAIPLISLASQLGLRTSIVIPIFGKLDFDIYYYLIIIPLIVTITTNTVNQLGGLNGLETICPAIVAIGMMIVSGQNAILLLLPMIMWLSLAFFNSRGRIFVGNTGSFAFGMTLAAFAIITDLKYMLLISLLPFILNSSLILLNYFFNKTKAHVNFDGEKLSSDHVRSLVTFITYNRSLTEKQVVGIISFLVFVFTLTALILHQAFL
jgi:UDP-N-acetylglucosamine--dolichyl-phosphate N-acetylglucosaminephosphotransferase